MALNRFTKLRYNEHDSEAAAASLHEGVSDFLGGDYAGAAHSALMYRQKAVVVVAETAAEAGMSRTSGEEGCICGDHHT